MRVRVAYGGLGAGGALGGAAGGAVLGGRVLVSDRLEDTERLIKKRKLNFSRLKP